MNRSLRNLVNKCDKVIIPDFGSNRTNLSYVREVTSDRNKLRDEFGLTRKTILVEPMQEGILFRGHWMPVVN